MKIIDELIKEVSSIEERFISDEDPSAMTNPDQLTDQPKSPDAEAERSQALDGTIYREPDSADPNNNPDVSDLEPDPVNDLEKEIGNGEKSEVDDRQKISLCLDVAEEGIAQAKDLLKEFDDEVAVKMLDEELMARFEKIAEMAAELLDDAEKKSGYDWVEDSEDDDTIEPEDTEPADSDLDKSDDALKPDDSGESPQ